MQILAPGAEWLLLDGRSHISAYRRRTCVQGWAQGSFVEAEAKVKAERSRQRRGKAAMSLTEARQGRGRELEAEARKTKFEARPRRGDPLKNPPSPRCTTVPNLVALSQTV